MILPFSIGCVSQSSVAVAEDRPSSARKPLQPAADRAFSPKLKDVDKEAAEKGTGSYSKGGSAGSFLPLPPRPNLTAGFQRVIKGFRGLTSQLFAYKGGNEEEDDEEERELEIGFPTDVQHVGHIGWDGTNTNALSTMMGWDGYRKPQPPASAAAPPEMLPMPSISLRQFQMAMAAQADDDDDDYGYNISSGASRHHQLRTAAA